MISSQRTNLTVIETQDGGMVEVTLGNSGKLTDAQRLAYVRALVSEATPRSGWLVCQAPSKALIDVVRATWNVIAPGWTSDTEDRSKPCSDETIAALISHSGISHHLEMIGAVVLPPKRAQARRALDANPALASRTVMGFRGYGDLATNDTLAALLAVEGSCIARSERRLDTDAFDNDVTRFDSVLVRGEAIESVILKLAEELAEGDS